MYRLVVPQNVKKQLDRIDGRFKNRILMTLFKLQSDPYIGKKLRGELQERRSVEVWPYRIIYNIDSGHLIVLIVKIGHRQGVYNG